jgi:hypothetical protein
MTQRGLFARGIGAALGLVVFVAGTQRTNADTILGTAENFAIIGASTVTNTGATTISGDIGLYPGTSITGANTISLTGAVHATDAAAQQAQIDATHAYNILAALPSTSNITGQNLGGMTLTPGVYTFNSSAQLTGTLTLNFAGASNQEFVFQLGSTLTTGSGAKVIIENGNATDGVFFQVGSSATLGSSTVFAGNILALDSISFGSSAVIQCGRAIAETAAVTMIGNTVSNNCPGTGGTSDHGSGGYSAGNFVSAGYTGGGFTGTPSGGVTSVPEPATFVLFGVMLVACLWLARRRHELRGGALPV